MADYLPIKLEEAMAGEEDLSLWVTLGFTSEVEPNDVLHIVVAKDADEQSRHLGHDTVYLERYDQRLSCYAGASEIRFSERTVELDLTEDGKEQLEFSTPIRFMACYRVAGFRDAVQILRRMASLPGGRMIRESREAPP